MRKFFFQKSEPIKMLIQQMNWKIFHFEGNGGSVSSVVDSVEIDALLDRSKLLWGLAPSEFLWCGDEKNKIEQSLKSQLTKLEQNSAEGGMLVIPHVDGGLIVIVSDEHSKIADGKPADWWSLHY